MNRWNLLYVGFRMARRGSSHTLSQVATCRLQTGRDVPCISNRKKVVTLLPQDEEERRFSPCPATAQPMRSCNNSANEKPLHLELPASSNELFVYNSPAQLSFLAYKEWSCLCVSGLGYSFGYRLQAVTCLSWIAILCYSSINPFAG